MCPTNFSLLYLITITCNGTRYNDTLGKCVWVGVQGPKTFTEIYSVVKSY